MTHKDIKTIAKLIDDAFDSLSTAKRVTPSPFLGKFILRRKTIQPTFLAEDVILPTHLTIEEL